MSRKFIAAVFLVVCSGGAAAPDSGPTYAGDPVGAPKIQVLDNPGFRIGYSDERRQPLWVAFRAASVAGAPRLAPRPESFSPDLRLERPVQHRDYSTRSKKRKYTRGHLAPNYVIGKLHGREGQLATFLMSNVSPQSRRLNELLWQRIEEAEVDVVAPAFGELWVITGPVFGAAPESLKKTGIAIPEGFYRIWLDLLPNGSPRVLAFLAPQEVCGDEPLSRYLVAVDEIERRTGLDFHAALDDPLEAELERGVASDGWNFGKIDRRPARYAENFADQPCELDK